MSFVIVTSLPTCIYIGVQEWLFSLDSFQTKPMIVVKQVTSGHLLT
jgi:hypothetical protein